MTYLRKTRVLKLAAGALAFLTSAASAAPSISAGPLYGATYQTHAVCYIFNAGASTVTISSVKILNPFGTSLTLTTDECGGRPLASGRSCGSAANVDGNTEYACTASVSDKAALRGDFQMRDANENAFAHMSLR